MKTHTIHAHNCLKLNYMDMPFQLLNSAVCQFAFGSVHFASARQRTVLHDAPAIDPSSFKQALRTDAEDTVKRTHIVHAVATLSAVDQTALCRFGAVDSDLCPFCGGCKSSVHHCIWECTHPKLVEARLVVVDENEKHIIDHFQHLPLALRFGIPVKMALHPSGPWWSNSPLQALEDSTVSPAVRRLFGMERSFDQFDSFTRWLSMFEHLDAKTAFRAFTGDGEVLPTPYLPAKVEGDVPAEPSAFSDGAFSNPTKPHLGLASATVWWPGRPTQPSDLELVHTDYRMCSSGLEILGFLGG